MIVENTHSISEGGVPGNRPAAQADPHQEYSLRRQRFETSTRYLERRSNLLSVLRLIVLLGGAVVIWLSAASNILHPLWITAPLLVFIVLIVIHQRVEDEHERCRRCADLYRAGLARLEDRWAGTGVRGQAYSDPAHPYAMDLDIFGKGSLFELLCTARSRVGERTLAQWLLHPACADEVGLRQQAIAELIDRVDLRQQLALLGEENAGKLDPGHLESWGTAPPRRVAGLAVITAYALPCLELAAVIAWSFFSWSASPLLMLLLAHGAFALRYAPWIGSVLRAGDRPARELALLAQLLAVIEGERFVAPYLQQLQQDLRANGTLPSQLITRLRRIMELIDSQRHMIFAPIAAFLLLSFHLARATERWRLRHGRALATWCAVLGRFEALAVLSGYAYEHPGDPFPEIVPVTEAPLIEANALVHPLLPATQAVRNDLKLDAAQRALVVSGSNMSGKTTLLRALGVNVVLAFAGAPVRARQLRLTPVTIGASITTHESLLEGRSRFFTEIRRFKQIVDLCAGETTVLFLFDEVLHGTNSHERRLGAELLLQGLLERGAIGLVTTHDLALAELAGILPALVNVHFEDRMDGDQLLFDYQLRPGVVTRSNALKLMELVGLPVTR